MTTIQIKVPNWLERICVWPVLIYRRRKYGFSFRKIYLGEGEWTIVDPEDYYQFGNFKWCISGSGSDFYAVRNAKIGPGRTTVVRLHREIMKPPLGLWVDHINGNALDNRRSNLRLATPSQNQFNKRKTKSKTASRFIGVSFDKTNGQWMSKLAYQRKLMWLGRFDSEIDAARAYDEAAKKYRGEFARLNFPSEG